MDDLELIRAGVPRNDDCPVLTRLSAFLVQQGTTPTLEHVFRRADGAPADLTGYLAGGVSASASTAADAAVAVRIKEFAAERRSGADPVWELEGWAQDPSQGLLRTALVPSVTERPGVYELSWGLVRDGDKLIAASQALLSVERSLFPALDHTLDRTGGPVTLGELRGWIMDNGAADNLLLDDVEFSDSQLLQALVAPVRLWNETPPPIEKYTTRTFPFKQNWLAAAVGHLHVMAANNYRRNVLRATAGGLTVPDKDKEREYMAEGLRLLAEYKDWLTVKKLEINMRKVSQSVPSGYSYYYGNGW